MISLTRVQSDPAWYIAIGRRLLKKQLNARLLHNTGWHRRKLLRKPILLEQPIRGINLIGIEWTQRVCGARRTSPNPVVGYRCRLRYGEPIHVTYTVKRIRTVISEQQRQAKRPLLDITTNDGAVLVQKTNGDRNAIDLQ